MLGLFKKRDAEKEVTQPSSPSSAERLAMVETQVKDADLRLTALDSEITDFARSNNLALNQFRGIEEGVGLPRQIITAFGTLHENRNRAAQDFQAALAVYAELK